MPQHLLQPPDVPSVPHAVYGEGVTERVRMDVFPDGRTVPLDDVSHLSLFEGKNRLIIVPKAWRADVSSNMSEPVRIHIDLPAGTG